MSVRITSGPAFPEVEAMAGGALPVILADSTTDVPLDVLTGGLMVATLLLGLVAYLGLKQAAQDADDARTLAMSERRANADAARGRFLAGVVLKIAEALEASDTGSQDAQQQMRGALAALPLDMLPLTRLWLGVHPTADGRYVDQMNRARSDGELKDLLRKEIATALHELTGTPPQQFNEMLRAANSRKAQRDAE